MLQGRPFYVANMSLNSHLPQSLPLHFADPGER